MSKTILFNIPATGHINPTLPLVRELLQRGEEVVYVNSEEYREKISATGVQFTAYPPVPLMDQLMNETVAEWNIARNMYSLIQVSGLLLPFTVEIIEREKPDYVMFDALASWGRLASRKLGIPNIGIVATFALDSSSPPPFPPKAMLDMMKKLIVIIPQYFLEAIRFRQKHGIFPVWLTNAVMCFGDMNIVFTSREFQPGGAKFPDNFKFVGTAIEPRPFDGEFPFEKLTGSPIVYISLGTLTQNADFFRKCFEAFGNQEGQYIIATGYQHDIAELGQIPDNFIVKNYVPQLELLPKVDAFITHGGLNSLHEGLSFGVPMLVVPQQIEQALNARQLQRSGAGIAINLNPPYGKVTVEQLRTSLTGVLASSDYKLNAKRLGKSLSTAGGVKRAVGEILAFVHS